MKTVLVIDDDPLLLNAVGNTLARAGFAILQADNPRDGVALARDRLPDLVLSDVEFPNGSGFGVLSTLLEDSTTAAIPVVLMTGVDDPQLQREGMEAGADDYLLKPFTEHDLVAAVSARLRRREKESRRLQESQDLFEAISSSALDAIIMTDPEGHISFWNATAEHMFGYSREEAHGQPLRSLFLAAPPTAANAHKVPALENAPSLPAVFSIVELTARHRNGSEFPVELSLSTVQLRGHPHAAAVVRDISSRKRAEEQLRKLSRAIEQCPVSILITSPQGTIEYVNPRFCEITGYSMEEVSGMNPRTLLAPEMHEEEYDRLWNTITCGGEWRGELQTRRRNGSLFWEQASISGMVDDHGRITHCIAVKEDISERKRGESERAAMEIQLRHAQKMESIGQLAAGIAHEINTPTQFVGDNLRFLSDALGSLRPVLALCQEVASQAPESLHPTAFHENLGRVVADADVAYLLDELPKAVEQSLEGVERVSRIVRAMKEFSHPGSEEKSAVDINRALETTLTVSRNEWKYVAELVTHWDPELPAVPCLPGEFNQVILNLVVNAAHAIADVTDNGSLGKGRITVSTRRADDWAEIRVGDTGTGIPEKVRARVFEPFFTTKGVGKGTGQGLAIAHSVIVEKHRGTIHFETEMGRGTTFVIRLPLNPTPNRNTAPHETTDPVRG